MWTKALRVGISSALDSTAGWRLVNALFPDVLVIFLWHSVGERKRGRELFFDRHDLGAGRSSFCDLSTFSAQLDFITSRFRVIDIRESETELRAGSGPLAVLTFDDGFKNVCEEAAPLLVERKLAACIFVNSTFADGGRLKPIDVINYVRNQAGADKVGDACDACGAADLLRNGRIDHRRLSGDARLPCVKERLLAAVGHTETSLAAAADAYARWEDLARLTPGLFTIGNHGAEHHSLVNLSRPQIEREVAEGAAAIERNLGLRQVPYAYTFGDPTDVSPEALDVIRRRHRVVYSAYGGFNLPGGADRIRRRVPVFSSADSRLMVEYAFPPRQLARAVRRRSIY